MGKRDFVSALGRCSLAGVGVFGSVLCAWSASLAQHPIMTAVHHQQCTEAVNLIRTDVDANDAQATFLAGRMLEEGICVRRDPDAAAGLFAHAAELGEQAAVLDHAAEVGLGTGAQQDYAQAGELCRSTGVDAQKQLSAAPLGYACTAASVTGRLLRERLPTGAFVPMAGAVVKVEFTPATGALRIASVPHVAHAEATLGALNTRLLINANQEVTKAWHDALELLPATTTLAAETHTVALSIDVDMTLEETRAALSGEPTPLLPTDIHITPPGPPR